MAEQDTTTAPERGVFRLDLAVGSMGERKRTPQGGLVAPANLTRVGVFPYRMGDGSTRRELRHPDEVFHPDSMATYPHAPVTVDHPGKVGPSNWKTHTVGTVGHELGREGNFLAGRLLIQHEDTIDRAENGELHDVSCGYTCDTDPTPGVYMGQPYDVVQRNIRINHVAIGPKGWGRMGTETAMRLDAAGAAVCLDEDDEHEDGKGQRHVVVVHGADGPKVTAHPTKAAATASAKELRASGAPAFIFSEQAYKQTQDPSFKLGSREAASEYANRASARASDPESHKLAAAAHTEAANAHYAVGASATGDTHSAKARDHEIAAAGAHVPAHEQPKGAAFAASRAYELSGRAVVAGSPYGSSPENNAARNANKEAGEAHLAARDAYRAEGNDKQAAVHAGAAEKHAEQAGGDWDESKHPRRENGKFDRRDVGEEGARYLRDDSNAGEPMTPEEKAALDKAEKAAKDATEALSKARQDAADATTEKGKLEAKAREDSAKIAQLVAENDLLKLQATKAPTADEQARADAAAEARVIERQALVADARLVFASKDDPEGKRWKADGKSHDAIRREVLAELQPTLKLDSIEGIADACAKSVALKGVFDLAMSHKRDTDKARGAVEDVANGPRVDARGNPFASDDEAPDADKARKDMVARKKDGWKTSKKDRRAGAAK